MSLLHRLTQVLVLGLMAWATSIVAAPQKSTQSFSAEDLSFFAKEVRPILQNNCALCHDSGKHTSGLSVESRESVLTGGNRGPAAEPGNPEQSRLIQAIRFNGELKMPPTGKLPDDTWVLRPQEDDRFFSAEDDTWYVSRVCGTFKERVAHPCQMPEAVLERIIRVASNPGDVILDPFAGSGTTLAVAHRLQRRYLGIELSPEYAEQVRQRLDGIQPDMFPTSEST